MAEVAHTGLLAGMGFLDNIALHAINLQLLHWWARIEEAAVNANMDEQAVGADIVISLPSQLSRLDLSTANSKESPWMYSGSFFRRLTTPHVCQPSRSGHARHEGRG